jgi:hypothetical protein
MGMRKDFIQSEQDKQQRKLRLEENRNITAKRSSTSNRLSTSESLSPSFDEIDRVSFYFLLLYRNKRSSIFYF